MMKQKKKHVIMGLSGGVDSAAAAFQLKEEGYEVIGVTFNFFNQKKMLNTAAMVADQLGITHHIVNAQPRFNQKVIQPFINGYKKGETPNPCMLCNQNLKFRLLMEIAENYDEALIATGHYAEIQKINDHYSLLASKNKDKDQSYFLYHLNQSILSRLILPLKRFESKNAVRKVIQTSLPFIANGPESQGICFIPRGNHSLFLKEALFGSRPVPQGNLVDYQGKILGKHRGAHGFTLGQTRGLGIENPLHLAVVDIIPKTNTVILGEEKALLTNEIIIEKVHLNLEKNQVDQGPLTFKTCRWGYDYPGTFKCLPNGEALVQSTIPVRAPTPGQALVFYRDRMVLGGGIIKKVDDSRI